MNPFAISLPGGTIIQALGGLRATLFFCVGGVALIATGVQTWRLHAAQEAEQVARDEQAAAETRSAILVDVNQANAKTITDLREANAAWARTCSFDPRAAEGAASTAAQNRDALPADDQRRQEEREKTYVAQPAAAEWSRVRIPADLARRLRE